MEIMSQERYKEYKEKLKSQGYPYVKTITYCAEMCECGRLYKDKRNSEDKMICSACYYDCDIESLKKLWKV